MMRLGLAALLTLAACAPATVPLAQRGVAAVTDLPAMRTFEAPRVTRPSRSNTDIATDFLDLSFMLESGRPIPVLTRFEGPITLRITGDPPGNLQTDLTRLLERLRTEAGLSITQVTGTPVTGAQVPGDQPASITVETVPRRQLQRAVPEAACFVVPRVSSWDEFRRNRRGPATDWTTLQTRERIAVFIPRDVSPQEVRDCLHEEIAQALGPLNDLYRLKDSVFNDDNFHTVLTGFDMLMLRVTYAPELRSGMTRDQVAALLPRILERLNPGGAGQRADPRGDTSRQWIDQIELALGPRASSRRRLEAAKRAVGIARAADWRDNRMAFSLFALGRLSLGREPELALGSFLQAASIYAADPATKVHEAHIAMQLAAFALSSGQAEVALTIVDANTDAVIAAENAALLATLLIIKSEALELLGRTADAAALRAEGLGWARYGFGPEDEVLRRAAEIAAISPRNRKGDPS